MEKQVTIRRNLEQLVHYAQDALSIIQNKEDIRCALEDLDAVQQMAGICFKNLNKELNKGNYKLPDL